MWLKIEPQEPLILGEVRAESQFLTGQTYIPGRILRGAWAEWLARQGVDEGAILNMVKRVRIGNFFPAPEWRTLRYALPLPLSAMSCKREGGFSTEPLPDHRGHGALDTLLAQLVYRLLERHGTRFPYPFSVRCNTCNDRMEAYGGFYALYRDGHSERHVSFHPRFHGQSKVALSRHRRASAEGMLYTASALSPEVGRPDNRHTTTSLVLVGRIRADDGDAVGGLKKALSEVPIGALHTRGYGRIAVSETDVDLPPLRERLEGFNRTLRILWKDIRRLSTTNATLPEEPEGLYFSVDLLAPGVFQDQGVPTLVPTLTLAGQTLQPIFRLTRPDMASGWSTAWGLPKPTNLAARMGSVYVFRWDGTQEELIPALQTLEEQGIGERRDEGFGECLVCHPFHQEVEER